MYRNKRCGKRSIAALLSAMVMLGSVAGIVPENEVYAAESVTEVLEKKGYEQTREQENWYVLGRPMTEEESEEQLRLIEYHRSFLGEISQEKEEQSTAENAQMLFSISNTRAMTSLSSAEQETVRLPRKYSSIEQGYTPAIRNQNPYGTCWAHASIALLEISMVKNKLASADNLSLSLPHAIYYYYRPVTDPLGGTADDYTTPNTSTVNTMYNAGGGSGYFAETTTAWMGPVLEKDFYNREYLMSYHNEYDPSSELNNVEKAYGKRAATVTEMVYVNNKDQEELKRAILEYGAVAIDYLSSSQYYNPTYAAQYCPYVMGDDHAVAVVGWNDYFPKENFSATPMEDGAWLVRNSWGTGHGDGGYFWLSYEDKSIARRGRAYRVAEADKYDNNYQYDGVTGVFDTISCSADKNLETVNVFEIQKERELLRGILFQTWEADYQYSIQIYKNPQDAADPASGEPLLETPLTGVKELAGRYTMDLEQPIWLEQGDKIAVSVTYSSSDSSRSLIAELDRPGTGQTGHSFYRMGDEAWTECAAAGKSNFIIKAFTDNAEGTHTHQWSEEWSYDGDAHWHACTGAGACDANLSHEGRAYAEHYGGTATCVSKAVCEGCGQEYGHILADQHIGDTQCTVCGKSITAGERKGAVNPDYEFTTVDEEKISSAADGKPKLIILFGAKCSYSLSTLTELAAETIPGVDICAVEVNFRQKSEVETVKNSLDDGPGLENIKFCYEPERGQAIRSAYTKAYTDVYTDAVTTPLPLICYIDENNEFKYLTSGAQDIEAIKGNLITYCGYEVNNLDVENPSNETFTTIEGAEVSVVADGKPKVLVFFHAEGCENSGLTLKAIAQNIPKGVDIYAIDMIGRAKETVTAFKDSYTPDADGIDYCYGGLSIDTVLAYMEAADFDTSLIVSPVLCYIDADNQLQYVSTGYCSNEQMRNILEMCCSYVEKDDPVEESFVLQKPHKTTYLTGEPLKLDGAAILVGDETQVALTDTMIDGFDSSQPGIVELKVSYQEFETSFDILVINKPTLEATQGMTLAEVSFPENEYGVFTWKDEAIGLEELGSLSYEAIFTPADRANYSVLDDISISVEVVLNVNKEEEPTTPITDIFTDVYEYDWFVSSVQYVYDNQIMQGAGKNLFAPHGTVTRAMVVETLYKLEGKPEVTDYSEFEELKDLDRSDWWAQSVAWALNEGVATGDTQAMTFNAQDPVTREQLVTFLYRYAKQKGLNVSAQDSLEGLLNAETVHEWAETAVKWAVAEGLIKGLDVLDEGTKEVIAQDLELKGIATRGQLATVLERFCVKYNF